VFANRVAADAPPAATRPPSAEKNAQTRSGIFTCRRDWLPVDRSNTASLAQRLVAL
jgi:hypothetical protein